MHHGYWRLCLIALSLTFFAVAVRDVAADPAVGAKSAVAPLGQAHAHNDYLHTRPLLDALDNGFTSVEADIFLVDGKLLLGHVRSDLKPERTLQALYLDPLRKRIQENGGSVYAGGAPFNLLIDIKTPAEPTYAVLTKVLADYRDILSSVEDGKPTQRAVNVAISGNRPIKTMEAEKTRYAGVDGRWGDLDSDVPAHFMPLISDQWGTQFKWRGQGPISEAEHKKLVDAVTKAHQHGRRIRFWATPENLAMWGELQADGVDMINTDDLPGLAKFLRGVAAPTK